MDANPTIVPGAEPKETPIEPVADAPASDAPANPDSVGELLKPAPAPKPVVKKEPKMVPEAVVIQLKNDIKDLKKKLDEGAPKAEVDADIAELAAEHNVDADFLSKLVSTIKSQTKKEFDAELEAKLKPFEAKDRAAQVDQIFTDNFNKTIAAMPEYKDIAKADVIKAVALDPKNANKTFAKILEETYGHLVTGKGSIESTVPRGGGDSAEIDYARAAKDTEYFKTIMADPDLKKEYNAGLTKRLKI